MVAFGVTLAAGVGAVARYLLDLFVQHRTRGEFPLGTLLVNVSGSFLLGLVTGLAIHHGLPATATLVIGAGFAGGYTTLSTWAWETLALGETGAVRAAALNVIGSFAAGLAAAGGGLGLALL
jgi:fluoride exporter